jgi:hypothetical protein
MHTYLTTVQGDDFKSGDFTLRIRLSRFRKDWFLSSLGPGRRIELRRPDGSREAAMLEEISVVGLTKESFSHADDATLYCFPSDPSIQLIFKPRITDTVAPPGTEIWLVD